MDWLQTIGPALLAVIGGIVGWFLKSRTDELRAVEERLSSERRKVYSDLLEPFVVLLTNTTEARTKEATRKMMSTEYRKAAMDLSLVAPDNVMLAYNDLWEYAYRSEDEGTDRSDIMKYFGVLLLEIRKGLGNRKTQLDEWDMLRHMIKDMQKLHPQKKD